MIYVYVLVHISLRVRLATVSLNIYLQATSLQLYHSLACEETISEFFTHFSL